MSQREILFKAKRTDNGEWVEGFPYYGDYSGAFILQNKPVKRRNARTGDIALGDEVFPIEVDGRTYCQYTGLTDKNGKKIFEGDVLSFYNDKPFTPWVAEVKWMHCEYYLDGVNRSSRVFLSDFLPEEMTITGNIHDN